jgi:hypothetical protein
MEQPYSRNDGLSPALARISGLPLEPEEDRYWQEQRTIPVLIKAAANLGYRHDAHGGGISEHIEAAYDALLPAMRELVNLGIFRTLDEACAYAFPEESLVVYPRATDLVYKNPDKELPKPVEVRSAQRVVSVLRRL